MDRNEVSKRIKRAEQKYLRRMRKYDWFVETERPFRLSIKYYPTMNLFKASNCHFDPSCIRGFSYGWWEMVGVIKGKVVFNNYGYSNTTRKHQSAMRNLLNQLGIEIDMEIPAPRGLQDLELAAKHVADLMGKALVEYKYARIKSKHDINYAKGIIKDLARLKVKVTKQMINNAVKQAESDRTERLERARMKRFQLMQVRSYSDVPPPGLRIVTDNEASESVA
jgi:hypothetical protein